MIKCIIFDWGGVMCQDSDYYTGDRLAEKYNLNALKVSQSLESIESEYSPTNEDGEFFTRAIKENSIPMSVDELKVLFNETPTRPEMLELAHQLKQEKFTLAILSTQMKNRTNFIKANNDLSDFDYLFFSSEMGIKKPDVGAFEQVLKKINLKPEECLFIDDCEKNIEVARTLGIKTILFSDMKKGIKDIKTIIKHNIY
jgi:epoxide hydrolase-like predicted phosphatase